MSKVCTPDPWEWMVRPDGEIYLATPHSGHLVVMDFVRMGMHKARPRFAEWEGEQRGSMGGVMRPATPEMLAAHPDARAIRMAPVLLKELRRLVKEIEENGGCVGSDLDRVKAVIACAEGN